MVFQSVIPALMAGNTVLLKPSEETPLWPEIGRRLNEAFPPNVLQLVIGDELGKRWSRPIDLVVFTGSREAGKHILREASGGLKRVILELGGKVRDVLGDADVDAAAAFAARNSFRNAGQTCRHERIYVDESVAEDFTRKLAERAAMRIGAGLDAGVDIGPLINRGQKQHVVDQVAAAVRDGAKVILGCHGPEDAGDGNFMPLTVLADVDHTMDIMREETFGPVACVMTVRSDDEAVRLANDTRFGLAACGGRPATRGGRRQAHRWNDRRTRARRRTEVRGSAMRAATAARRPLASPVLPGPYDRPPVRRIEPPGPSKETGCHCHRRRSDRHRPGAHRSRSTGSLRGPRGADGGGRGPTMVGCPPICSSRRAAEASPRNAARRPRAAGQIDGVRPASVETA